MTDLLNTEEAAALARVSTETITEWCKSKKLPATKPGRRWYIRRQDLESMFDPFAPPSVHGASSSPLSGSDDSPTDQASGRGADS